MEINQKAIPLPARESSEGLDYWRNFFESLGSSSWVWNLSTDRVEFTASWLQSMGYTVDDMNTGNAWFDTVHPEDAGLVTKCTEECIQGISESLDIEFRLRRKDGVYRWVNSRAKIISIGSKQPEKYFFGLYSDVTEQQADKVRLVEHESRWNTALEGSGVGVWEWDIQSGELYWSPEFYRLVKLDEKHTKPTLETWNELIVPEHRERNRRLVQQCLTDDSNQYRDEHQITCGDGSRIWILTRDTITKYSDTNQALRMTGTLDDITLRKKQEHDLEVAHERMHTVTSTIPGFVYEYHRRPDDTHYYPFASAGMKDVYGVNPIDVMEDASPIRAKIHPEDVQFLTNTIRESAKSGDPWHLQYRIMGANGDVRILNGFANRREMLEPDGTAIWFGYTNDVTEQVETERRGEQVAQLVPGALFQYSIWPDGRHLFPYATKGMGKFFGVSDESLAENGDIPLQALHPDDAKDAFNHVRLCGTQGIGWDLEYRVLINNKIRWHQATANIAEAKNLDGSITWNGYLSDITEAKERELEISEKNQLLQQATATIPGVIYQYVIGPDGSVSIPFLSDGVVEIFGVDKEAALNNPLDLWTYVHPDDKLVLGEAVNRGQAIDMEYRVLLPKIGEQWRRVLASCTHGDTGTVTYYAYVIDATQQKNNEMAMRHQSDAIALSNKDLEQFNYVAAHDLKEPLRAIKHLSEWIEEDLQNDVNESVATNLARMRTRVERLQLLVDDLAAYSRAGRQGSDTSEINLSDLVGRVFDDIAHLECEPDISGVEDVTLTTVEIALETVFKNLINNAAQHRDAKSNGVIKVETKTDEYFVTCSVEDDGPGIAPEHHERVFKMYQRLNPDQEGTGSGSGLTIVRRIIGAAHGSIFLESPLSNDDRGTRFTFKWPVNWPARPS